MNNSLKSIWSILCLHAHIDARTNLISLIDIVEKLDIVIDRDELFLDDKSTILKQPMVFPIQFTIVNYWEIPKELAGKSINVEIDIVSPNKKSLGKAEFGFETERNTGFHRTLTDFSDLPIVESGIYTFVVKAKNEDKSKSLAKIPLQINIQRQNT